MTTKTTYICDRCGASRDSATDKPLLWSVSIKAMPYASYSYCESDPSPKMFADWCQPCCELLGLKLEFPFKRDHHSITLTKEQLDKAVREILQATLRRGLGEEAAR